MHSHYYNIEKTEKAVASGNHRGVIGGAWDVIGPLQIDFLKSQGLQPQHRLLDIGCGSLRLGHHAVRYLDAGNYFGTDLNPSLLEAGYQHEIVAVDLKDKLPRSNLVTDEAFEFPTLPRQFDFAIAQSLFTHLPLNYIRLCLGNLARHLDGPCSFFFTVFLADTDPSLPIKHPAGVTTHPQKDPYHYTPEDMSHIGRDTPWTINVIGEWGHPRDQKMVQATIC